MHLRIAEARVRQARAQKGFAEADYGPTVNAAGSYSRQKQSENQPIIGSLNVPSNVPFENNVYQAGFDAAWEIDLFGGKRRAVQAAAAELSAVEFNRQDVMVSLLSEVTRNYVQIRGAQQQLAVLQNQIKAQAETVEITRSQVEIGAATDLDLQRALALLATIQSQAPPIETAIQTSIHRLGVLLAQPSQFISSAKLWRRRKYTFVETVPFFSISNNWSARVSTIRNFHSGFKALSLETLTQRFLFGPSFWSMMKSTTSFQMRFGMCGSVTAI